MKKEKKIHNGQNTIFSINGWIATYQRIKLEHLLITSTKINSKWIEDPFVRLDTIKLLDENRTLFDINCSNIFLVSIS